MASRILLRTGLFVGLLTGAAAPPWARAADYFIVAGLEDTQAAAQQAAAASGAWVLDTDLYPKLPPNRFAVVHGPYRTSAEAKAELSFLQTEGEMKDAQVKDAGECRLPTTLGSDSVPRSVFTALLGELTVTVANRPGSTGPCEPQEPYQRVEVGILNLGRHAEGEDAGVKPVEVPLPLGGFFVIRRTGEIQRLRICME